MEFDKRADESSVSESERRGPISGQEAVAQCFYSWREIYPELQLLLDNIEVIKEESKKIGQVQYMCVSIADRRSLTNYTFLCTVGAVAGRPLQIRRRG